MLGCKKWTVDWVRSTFSMCWFQGNFMESIVSRDLEVEGVNGKWEDRLGQYVCEWREEL